MQEIISKVVYDGGAKRVIHHSEEILYEDKRLPTLQKRLETGILGSDVRSITTMNGEKQIFGGTYGRPHPREDKVEIHTTLEGLNTRQLLKKHRNDRITMYVKI